MGTFYFCTERLIRVSNLFPEILELYIRGYDRVGYGSSAGSIGLFLFDKFD